MKTGALLNALQQVESISTALKTTSWVWGGLTADIYQGKLLRKHHDIDFLTWNLHELIDAFAENFNHVGWRTRFLSNGDLKLEKEDVKVHLGHIEFGQEVRWMHNGDTGSLYFPIKWLVPIPQKFCSLEIHVVAPQLQFVLLDHPELLNPDWHPREKDLAAKAYFRNLLETEGIMVEYLIDQIHVWEKQRDGI